MMRRNAYWMKQQDDRILEYLESEGWATPRMIARQPTIDISRGHVEERLMFLWYAGFVWPFHGEMFELSTEGRLYLRGEIDARHQPTPTVDKVLRG